MQGILREYDKYNNFCSIQPLIQLFKFFILVFINSVCGKI